MDRGERRIPRLGGLGKVSRGAPAERGQHGRRHAFGQLIFCQHAERIRIGRRVGHGRSRGDRVERAPHDIRDHERDHPRREGGPGKLTPFNAGQVLAHGIYLRNVGAGPQEKIGSANLVLQRDPLAGKGEERRGAAGDQENDQIIGGQVTDEPEDLGCSGLARGPRQRMGGFPDGDPPER